RLVKSEDGSGSFEPIHDPDEVIKLAGRPGFFDLAGEYGVPDKLIEALDITTQLAMAAGLDALREAGIPLVQSYRRVSTGKFLPDRWMLPEPVRDETGVIFASAFPGNDRLADEFARFFEWQNLLSQVEILEDLRRFANDQSMMSEINRRISEIRQAIEREPYEFDRRFLFRVLSMGHSQFAEFIGARGPNTQVNAACASTTQAVGLAEDWIRTGRCRRVLVIAADDVTSDNLIEWVGAGFLAVGAAAIDDRVEDAALPFDKRRHGTLMGMGACALVLESEDAVRERGMRGIVELMSSETCNSAFHGTRLDVDHIAHVMNNLLSAAERRFGIHRHLIAPYTVFVSHETFTPARGGSASAEVIALQKTFSEAVHEVIVANTKGFTGHPMGVGVEDVISVKILEHGIVPPMPNLKEVDDEFRFLNLSRGGRYPVEYALHLAAGFGSQIAMALYHRIPGGPDRVDQPMRYQRWLSDVSGMDHIELEVFKRVLRVKSNGAPSRPPVASSWQYGTGPCVRAVSPGNGYIPTRRGPVNGDRMPVQAAQPPAETDTKSSLEVHAEVPTSGNGFKEESSHARPTTEAALQPASSGSAAPAAPAAPVAPIAPAPAAGSFGVEEKILEIVAAKTGYPRDMLDLDLDLEADLGIDTVKQAETFMSIRQEFDIPRRDDLKLRDYPTLARVIQFVYEMRPELRTAAQPVETPSPEATTTLDEPVAAPEAPATTGESGEPVAEKIMEIVAEKTGYPKDMLELDLDLEADLGIDTVKQAETFMSIRQAFDIPRRDDLKLRDYPTLARVIQFVYEMRPDLAHGPDMAQKAGDGEGQASEQPVAEPVFEAQEATSPHPFPLAPLPLENADRVPRRVPVPSLRPSLDLCKPTGVTLGEASRVVVMFDRQGAGKKLAERLKKLGATVLAFKKPLSGEEIEKQLKEWSQDGPIQGVFWLAALDAEPPLEEMELEDWRAVNQERVKNLYVTMRALYDQVAGPGTFLVSATHLGGLHGYAYPGDEGGSNAGGASAPAGGAVAGFTKAFKRERPEALVKVVDFETELSERELASILLQETQADPGIVEVGYYQGLRYTIGLIEQPAQAPGSGIELGKESVLLVTGAAGSVTSAVIADLAAASG
ncbi:MAG: beta-ketoacyl synthase, partial [Chloroflexota bacterium]